MSIYVIYEQQADNVLQVNLIKWIGVIYCGFIGAIATVAARQELFQTEGQLGTERWAIVHQVARFPWNW